MTNKASKEYWDRCYSIPKFRKAKKNDSIRLWIEEYFSHLPTNEDKECIEIGCFPGTYLAVFGDLGYRLSGIDFCDNLSAVEPGFKDIGYKTGSFINEDFLTFESTKKFDIVASFGFIEHFTNYVTLIEKHANLVSSDGYLILEAPNFIGKFQNKIHQKFDYENLQRHHLPAMNIDIWKKTIEHLGFEVLYCGYFGTFNIILENDNQRAVDLLFVKSIKKIKWLLNLIIPKGSKSFAPYCGLIAKRKT